MRRIYLLFCLTCCFFSTVFYGENRKPEVTLLSSLKMAKQYAAEHSEYPDIDNTDWSKPDYTSYWKKLLPGYYDRFLRWVGLRKALWTAQSFRLLLEQITKERELNSYLGRFIFKLDSRPGSKFIIFGDLHGAFHSFVRDLRYLELHGIINEDLSLNSNYYFVFNGNVIDKSPYSLELLTLVMQIMKKNPNKVFYIRGFHEDKQEWYNHSLKSELKIRAEALQDSLIEERIPLGTLINRFFNTLPLALYLVVDRTAKEIEVVRISNFRLDNKEIKEKRFAGFLDIPGDLKPQLFRLTNNFTSKKRVDVKALVTGEALDIYYKKTLGLRYLGRERGVNTFAVLSSPIGSHRLLYEFFYDAFAVIETTSGESDWRIAIYNQDVRSKLGFSNSKVYNIFSGIEISGKKTSNFELKEHEDKALEAEVKAVQPKLHDLKKDIIPPKPEVKPKEFKLGTTLDLSQSVRGIGSAYKEGMLLAIDEINNDGGVNGIQLKLEVLDDGFEAKKARQNVQELLKRNIDVLVLPLGGETLESYIDLVREEKVLVLFPATGVLKFREPELRYIINYRLSNKATSQAITEYVLKSIGSQKIAFLYRDDSLGKNSLAGAIKALNSQGITEWIDLPFTPGAQDFQEQISTLREKNFTGLGFFALGSCVKNFIRSSNDDVLLNKTLFGNDPLTEQSFQNFATEKGLTIAVPYQVPNPKASEIQIVQEYIKAAKSKMLGLNPFALEGYIAIRLLSNVLKKNKYSMTKDEIVAAFGSLRNYDFNGITLRFDPQNRTLVHPLWIADGKAEWKEYNFKEPQKEPQVKELKEEADGRVLEGNIGIGSTMDLSKSEKAIGTTIKQVLSSYARVLNNTGGIKNRKVDLTILDDGYNPVKALKNVRKFIDEGIGILLNPLGSPTLSRYLDLVKNQKIMVFFPRGGSPSFFNPSLPYLLNFGPSYYDEGYHMVNFADKNTKMKNIVLFYQDTVEKVIAGAQKALQELGKEWIEIAYDPSSVNYSSQVAQMEKENPDTIFLFSTPTVAMSLIRQIGITFFLNKNIIGGLSYLNVDNFKNFMQRNGLPIYIPSQVPNPRSSELAIVEEFRNFAQKYSIPLEPVALKSYICFSLLKHFISTVTGQLTWEKVMLNAEQLKYFDFGGIKFTFEPKVRRISNSMWIDSGKDKWIQIELKTP